MLLVCGYASLAGTQMCVQSRAACLVRVILNCTFQFSSCWEKHETKLTWKFNVAKVDDVLAQWRQASLPREVPGAAKLPCDSCPLKLGC